MQANLNRFFHFYHVPNGLLTKKPTCFRILFCNDYEISSKIIQEKPEKDAADMVIVSSAEATEPSRDGQKAATIRSGYFGAGVTREAWT